MIKNTNALLMTAIYASVAAGRKILDVYHTDFAVHHKQDQSPLTLADQRAHDTIAGYLKPCGIPVLSEEGRDIPFDERKGWPRLWIVDPLDGTKEFVKKNDEFTVNIALVSNNRPFMGVVYVPVKDQLYWGCQDMGSYKIEQAGRFIDKDKPTSPPLESGLHNLVKKAKKLPFEGFRPLVFTVMGSRSHPSPALDQFIEKLKKKHEKIDFVSAGSSLKICMVAEGSAHIYPRLGPTMEWDTAAGHAVAEFAGSRVCEYETDQPLTYNKENLLNPWFVVKHQ